MILATLSGSALQVWAGWPDAGSHGFFVGLVVALLVPTGNKGCQSD